MGRTELFNAVNNVNLDKFTKLLNTRAKVGEHSENGDTLLHSIVKLIFDNNFNIAKLSYRSDKSNQSISEQEKTAKIENFEKNNKKLIQMAEILVNEKYIYRLKDTKNTDKYFYDKIVNIFIRFTNYIKKLFISNKKINIDDRDFQGNTILSLISNNSKSDLITKDKPSFKFELPVATKEALFKISNKLINMGANVDIGASINIEDSNHSLPLDYEEMLMENFKLARQAIDNNDLQKLESISLFGIELQMSFVYAATNNYMPGIIYLLENKGANINVHQENGCTALHIACVNNNYEMAKYLIQKGAKIDCVEKNLRTPLHITAAKGNPAITELLLTKATKPKNYAKMEDSHNYTPYIYAFGCRNQLEKEGKNVEDYKKTLFSLVQLGKIKKPGDVLLSKSKQIDPTLCISVMNLCTRDIPVRIPITIKITEDSSGLSSSIARQYKIVTYIKEEKQVETPLVPPKKKVLAPPREVL